MTQNSIHLSLPLIQNGQAQKHVTHNEALALLDQVVQLSVLGQVSAPSGTEPEGARYIVTGPATGDFLGQEMQLAQYEGGAWSFAMPQTGWIAWDQQLSAQVVFDGMSWREASTGVPSTLGINTSADTMNRFALASQAALFTHDGAGHQIKVNKAGIGESASVLFQSNWSGRAEMGIVGGDDFSIKVSADGANFVEALRFDGATGAVSGQSVQQSATDTGAGRLARADYAYSPGNLLGTVSEAAGIPAGAVIERGSSANGDYVRFADGTQICTVKVAIDVSTSNAQNFSFPMSFAADPAVSLSHASDFPNTSLYLSNIRVARGVAGPDQHWRLALLTGGTVSGSSDDDSLYLTATGRWF
jgi:hypothetical protein